MYPVIIRFSECHDTCLDVESTDGHVANVNPVGYADPAVWRIDCDTCFTCVRSGFSTKAAALLAAIEHVLESSDTYWQRHNAGLA